MCPNVNIIPHGSLDDRYLLDFVMHLLEKGQGEGLKLSNGNKADIMLGTSYLSNTA